MAGKFELYTDSAGKFRFRFKSGNGEIVAVGEAYSAKAAAMSGIESIKRQAAEAQVHDMTSDMPNKPAQSQSHSQSQSQTHSQSQSQSQSPKPGAHKQPKPKQPAGMGSSSSGTNH